MLLDHNEQQIGEIVYAEPDDRDRLSIVGVVEGLRLDKVDRRVYC
jgi:hypothetical protein